MLIDLVLQEGRITGALALDIRKGEFIRIAAKAVVMATGGWHKAFWPNTGMRDLSGHGLVVAQRVREELGNLEFITFCCNVLLAPPMWRGSLASQENVHPIQGDGTAGHGNLDYTAARHHALSGHDEENDGSSFGHRRSSLTDTFRLLSSGLS